jgi:SAM-dependent methyltransferase
LAAPKLALGVLPPCNRFSATPGDSEGYALAMGICSACALVQLSDCPAAQDVTPRVPWIVYNEPDAHLDAALETLSASLGTAGRVMGIGPFDLPLLDRLRARGWDPVQVNMLGGMTRAPQRYPYLETLQAQIQPSRMAQLAAQSGTADLVICRYLLEHSHAPAASLEGLGAMLNPGGRLIVEVPDSSKFLARRDYSFIWEEHLSYFTEESLRRLLAQTGYTVLGVYKAVGAQEDLLVAVVCRGTDIPSMPQPAEIDLFAGFAADFSAVRKAYQAKAHSIIARGGQIAILGAGHQAVMFLNALGLAKDVAFLADDHPDKAGTYAPGAAVPIVSTSTLDSAPGVTVCLLSTNPRIEGKVREKLGQFLARGGQIYSIFAGIGRPTLIEPVG